MRDPGSIKIIECALQAGEALVDGMVGSRSAHVVAGRSNGSHDLRRRGEQWIVSVRPAWPSERHLLMADCHVGRCDHRLHSRQQRRKVVAAMSASLGVFLCSVPQGVVPQQIAVHHHRRADPFRLRRRPLGGLTGGAARSWPAQGSGRIRSRSRRWRTVGWRLVGRATGDDQQPDPEPCEARPRGRQK